MALLKDKDRLQLQEELKKLQSPVRLVFFTQSLNCEYCPMTQEILEELTTLSDKIQLQTYNFAIDKEQVAAYKIARVPAIAVVRVESIAQNGAMETRERDYGIRYYGIPAGYEFAALIGDIIDVSSGESGLSAGTKTALANLKEPVHLQVFSTPT